MFSIIKSDQVSGSDHLELLLCGICKNFAIKPQVHDGGYNQKFCQRLFCSSCIPLRINGLTHQRVNRRGLKETNCPFYPNCGVDFNHPYFRKLSEFERMEYFKVIITCRTCNLFFSVDRYLDHIINCVQRNPSQPQASGSSNNNNQLIQVTPQPMINQSLMKMRRQVTSVNQLRVPVLKARDNNNLIINFRSINGFHTIELPESISSAEALETIAREYHLDHTKIDLVYLSHMSITQFERLSDFVQDCPEKGDLNLITKDPKLADSQYDLRLSVLGLHPNRGYYQAE